METGKKWYVIHTYSGYENKVMTTLEKKVQSLNMEDKIGRILVPMEDEIEEKNGVQKVVRRKIFPGYVLVEMEANEQLEVDPHSWYIVRNTPGVTGFVGSTTKPVPLSDSEVERILRSQTEESTPTLAMNVELGESVRVTSGAFQDRVGTVAELHQDKGTVTILIEMFNQETPVELEYSEIEKL